MSKTSGNISIHAQNIMPVIKRWLYSDKDIFVREMVSNGCDAITKQKMIFPSSEEDYRVTVTLDEKNGELRFSDNGIGMTAEEVKKYINQVAFSGAEEFLKNYEGDNKGGIIGHFGLGFYSAFMVSDKVVIETMSSTENAEPVRWESADGMKYSMSAGNRTFHGTDVILHISEEEKEFLDEYRIRDILHRYCGFMNFPVYFDIIKTEAPVSGAKDPEAFPEENNDSKPEVSKDPERINSTEALWLKNPKDCSDEEYKNFYKDVFHTWEDPLFQVHLNMDYPFNLKGILYFPKLTGEFGNKEGEIKLFSGQVFVADNIKEVIPEFLMLLKGVIDCPDLPLNVSRSFLQNDGYVKKLNAYITRKVADRLTGLFNTERDHYQKYWDDIHPFIKYGCMKDAKFYDQVKDTLLFKTTEGNYLTLQEYFSKNEEKLHKKVIYTNDPARQSANIAMYKAESIDVVVLDALIDLNFQSFMESSANADGLSFVRVDAESDTLSRQITDEEKSENENLSKDMESLFRTATGNNELNIKITSLKDESVPALLTQDEQGRRFGELSRLYGNDFKMPESLTMVLNRENPIISGIMNMSDEEKRKMIAAELFDLSRMASRPLEKDEITAFLSRSSKILSMLVEEQA